MRLLMYSGILYLIGISILLACKPTLMFSKDGNWKEFGIGRSKERYTWMPFWLFAILWAIISYTIVLVVIGESNSNESTSLNTTRSKRSAKNSDPEIDIDIDDHMNELMQHGNIVVKNKGYYVKTNNGRPKYIYLGPQAPNLHDDEF